MRKEQSKDVEVTIGKEHPKSEAEEMQLPIERLMPYPLLQSESVNGTKACTMCEYLLHYLQDTITNPATEVINIKFYEKSLYIYTFMQNITHS